MRAMRATRTTTHAAVCAAVLGVTALLSGVLASQLTCLANYAPFGTSMITCSASIADLPDAVAFHTIRRGVTLAAGRFHVSSALTRRSFLTSGLMRANYVVPSVESVSFDLELPDEIELLYYSTVSADGVLSEPLTIDFVFSQGTVLSSNTTDSALIINSYTDAIAQYGSTGSTLTLLMSSLNVVTANAFEDDQLAVADFALNVIADIISSNSTLSDIEASYIAGNTAYIAPILSFAKNATFVQLYVDVLASISAYSFDNGATLMSCVSDSILKSTSPFMSSLDDTYLNSFKSTALSLTETSAAAALKFNLVQGQSNYSFASNEMNVLMQHVNVTASQLGEVSLSLNTTNTTTATVDVNGTAQDTALTPSVSITSQQLLNLGLDTVTFSLIAANGSIYPPNNSTLVSNAFEVSMYNGNLTKVNISNLSSEIMISFPILDTNQSVSNTTQKVCVWWTGSSWSKDGCTLTQFNSSYATCSCSHLTLFAIEFRDIFIPQSLDSLLFSKYAHWTVFISLICGIYGVWIIGVALTYIYDAFILRSRHASPMIKTRLYLISLFSGTQPIKGLYEFHLQGEKGTEIVELACTLTTKASKTYFVRIIDVGELSGLSILPKVTDTLPQNLGGNPTLTCTILDPHREIRYTFVAANNSAVVDLYTQQTLRLPILRPVAQQVEMSFLEHLYYELRLRIYDRHLWLSILFRPVKSSFTSMDRFIVAYMWIVVTACCGLAWFNVYSGSAAVRVINKVIVAIIASSISFVAITPTEYLLRHTATHSGPGNEGLNFNLRVLAYVFAVVVTAGCTVVCGLYALELYRYHLLLSWFESFMFSVVETLLISQPLLVLFVACYSLCRAPSEISEERLRKQQQRSMMDIAFGEQNPLAEKTDDIFVSKNHEKKSVAIRDIHGSDETLTATLDEGKMDSTK